MSQFVVGEVAVFFCPGRSYHGKDVLITQGLHFTTCDDADTGETKSGMFYGVQPSFLPCSLQKYVAEERLLRKKRPPQDWRSLCSLDSVSTAQEKTV